MELINICYIIKNSEMGTIYNLCNLHIIYLIKFQLFT